MSESNGLDAGDGSDDGGLSVCDMADGADVEGCLSADDLGGGGGEVGYILIVLGFEVFGFFVEDLDFLGGKELLIMHFFIIDW